MVFGKLITYKVASKKELNEILHPDLLTIIGFRYCIIFQSPYKTEETRGYKGYVHILCKEAINSAALSNCLFKEITVHKLKPFSYTNMANLSRSLYNPNTFKAWESMYNYQTCFVAIPGRSILIFNHDMEGVYIRQIPADINCSLSLDTLDSDSDID